MTEFNERKLRPKKDNKNYYSDYNYLYAKGWVDECTWYVVGRLLEIGVPRNELIKNLPQTNAENWYNDSKYPKQQTPEPGCIIVWSAGKVHHAADGMGHVAFVEHVYPDGRIRITESGKNMKFQSRIIAPPYKFPLNVPNKQNYKLDGFVKVIDIKPIIEPDFKTGDKVKLLYDKCYRTSPKVINGKKNNKYLYKNLTPNAKKYSHPDKNGYARYDIGAIVSIKEVKIDDKGNTWLRTNSLWFCGKDKTGLQAIKL